MNARTSRSGNFGIRFVATLLAGVCLGHAATAAAQTATQSAAQPGTAPADDASQEGADIVVTGRYQFLSADTRGATNLPLSIDKVPQAISLVSNDFIKAADLKTSGEIAQYTPGAVNAGDQLGLGTRIVLRGFPAGRAVDGIQVQGRPSFEPDFATIERLEIVKGPASLVYGVASPGGLVNYVTKSATRSTPSYILGQAGNWNRYRLEGQLTGAVDRDGAVRLIGVAVQDWGESFLTDVERKTTTLYGGVNADLAPNVSVYLHGGYQRFNRTAFDGTPVLADGTPAALPRSFFVGSKNAKLLTNIYHAEAGITWQATDMLEVVARANLERSNTTGISTYAFGLEADGTIQLAESRLDANKLHNTGGSVSAVYKFDDLGMPGSFLSAQAIYQNHYQLTDWVYSDGVAANVNDGEVAIRDAFDSILAPGSTVPLYPYFIRLNLKTTTFSAQGFFQLAEPLSVLLGASWSKPNITQSFGGTPDDFTPDGKTNLRGSVNYEPLPGLTTYVSFSQSFNPQTLFAVGNRVLAPLEGEQYELGAKYRSSGGGLLLTGAVYQIKQKNQAQYDTTVGGLDYYKPLGEVRHRGVEVTGLGQITREWQVNAGFSYLDPVISKSDDRSTIGETTLYVPKTTASLFTNYVFGDDSALSGFTLGGGVRYVDSVRTALDDSTKPIGSYTLVDLSVGYTTGDWTFQVNAKNVTDKTYYINNYQTLYYGNVIGEPASVALLVRRNF